MTSFIIMDKFKQKIKKRKICLMLLRGLINIIISHSYQVSLLRSIEQHLGLSSKMIFRVTLIILKTHKLETNRQLEVSTMLPAQRVSSKQDLRLTIPKLEQEQLKNYLIVIT